MYGNFYRVNMQGSDKVRVEGWLVWETGDSSADLSISVEQAGSTAAGGKVVRPGTDKKTWEVEIELDNTTFVHGFAIGHADAVVHNGTSSAGSTWDSAPIPVN